jgi:hypothetical protein
MDSITETFLVVVVLAMPITIALIAMAVVALRRLDANASQPRRLTHSETAAVEDAIVTTEALATQIGAILHILRRGPYAYPDDLPAGVLWQAVAEVLEKQGHLPSSNGNSKPGETKPSSSVGKPEIEKGEGSS